MEVEPVTVLVNTGVAVVSVSLPPIPFGISVAAQELAPLASILPSVEPIALSRVAVTVLAEGAALLPLTLERIVLLDWLGSPLKEATALVTDTPLPVIETLILATSLKHVKPCISCYIACYIQSSSSDREHVVTVQRSGLTSQICIIINTDGCDRRTPIRNTRRSTGSRSVG